MNSHFLTRVILAIVSGCFASTNLLAVSIRHDVNVSQYDALAAGYPSVGYFGDASIDTEQCTGTLVGPQKVLIASHCIDYDADGVLDFNRSDMGFGLGSNVPGTFSGNVSSAIIHPEWIASDGDPSFDVAVLNLSQSFNNVRPSMFYAGDPSGLVGTMVGYGNQGTGTSFPSNLASNDRLAAQNIVDLVGSSNGSDDVVETDFDSPNQNLSTTGSTSPIALEGTTAPGDSGGPLFVRIGYHDVIVGTLNGGVNENGVDSAYGDVSTWAHLGSSENLAFLAAQQLFPFVAGDYNRNGTVGQEDYDAWKTDFGSTSDLDADGNNNGIVDAADYVVWRDLMPPSVSAAQSVPEPSSLWIAMLLASLGFGIARRDRRNKLCSR